MRARFAFSALAVSALLLGCDRVSTAPLQSIATAPASITHGTLDGNRHPAVILIVMDIDGTPAFRCSGTLIAPKLVLTAGHCAGEPGEFSGLRVFTESDVENGNNNFPFAGPNTIEAVEWHSHPLFTENAFFLHDVGVVLLSKAVKLASNQYGKLPSVDQLDALKPSSSTVFTAVGYGVQRINPVFVEQEKIRMFAEPHLIQINTGFTGDFSLLLSNNASTGGTCFGDSGGPNYLGSSNVVAAVTSFALNGTCGGTGGVFRLDRKNVVDFVSQYLN
ncbi:MAG TPA: trypsin-like serine protease [Gemmatimonadaceae bacterium]